MKSICTLCSWQETNVWKPGATPNPNWSMKDGSSWLWIWTLTPASNDVSSAGSQRMWDQISKPKMYWIFFCVCVWTDTELWDNDCLTCLPPDRQVFVLLNVQHELQSITHTSLGGNEGRASVLASIKGVTLPVASEDLRDTEVIFYYKLHYKTAREFPIYWNILTPRLPLGVSIWLHFQSVCVCACDRDSMKKNSDSSRSERRRVEEGMGRRKRDLPMGLSVSQSTEWNDGDWQTGDLTLPHMLSIALIMDLMLPWRPSMPARKKAVLIFLGISAR